ncbi:MAG: tetratricopeptide repeat protein [Bdellovibrionales bacterium]
MKNWPIALFSWISVLFVCAGCQYLGTFQSSGPKGQYYLDQWERAQTHIKNQDYSEAESILAEIYNSTLAEDPGLSTRALFELAVLRETHGQWDQALAQFRECETKKEHLPMIKAELELPARLSGLYATLVEIRTSDYYSKKTEAALQTYAAQIRLDQQPAWWAETFYRMGYFPINEMRDENWLHFASRFEATSPYLVRSMELSDGIWSRRSFDLATHFVKKSLEQISVSEETLEDNWAFRTQILEEKMNRLGSIFEKMKLWKPLDLKKSKYVENFYEQLVGAEKELERRLSLFRPYTPPSNENRKRNAIRREGLQLAPVPESIDKNEKDPNL